MCFYLIGTSDYWPKKVSQMDIHHINHTPLNHINHTPYQSYTIIITSK